MITDHDVIKLKTIFATKKDFKSIDKKLDLILDYFDGEILNHGKRLDRIEDHLNLPVIS